MRFCVLVNGGAGSVDDDDQDAQRAEIEEAFTAVGAEVDIRSVPTAEFPSTMRRIWDGDDRPDAIVVAGGDGTVNCAAGEAAGTDLVIGVLPLGTFNHFAKDLGLPTGLAAAAASLVSGAERRVDLGEVNGRVFVNNSVLGLYPALVAVRDRIRDQRGWGKVRAVPVAAVAVLRAFPVHQLDLRGSDGYARSRMRTPFVFVGNGAYDVGDRGRVGGRQSMVDGRLGLYVARVVSRWGLVRTVVRSLVSGTQSARHLDRTEVTELVINSKRPRVRVALDGEICWLETPLRFRSRPAALRVLAPCQTDPAPAAP